MNRNKSRKQAIYHNHSCIYQDDPQWDKIVKDKNRLYACKVPVYENPDVTIPGIFVNTTKCVTIKEYNDDYSNDKDTIFDIPLSLRKSGMYFSKIND